MRGQGCYTVRWVLSALMGLLVFAGSASADTPPPGSTWHETYIQEAEGTSLHADVLRSSTRRARAGPPVIPSIGPSYTHAGQTAPAGPAEDTSYTPVGDAGPSGRFFD